MKSKERLVWMAVAGVLIAALFIKGCKNEMLPIWKKCPVAVKCPTVDTATSYIAVFDSLQKRIDFLVKNNGPSTTLRVTKKQKAQDPAFWFALEAGVDTVAIIEKYKATLADCFAENTYTLPYRDDSIAAVMNITVSENKAQEAKLSYKLIFPVAHTSNLVTVTTDTTVLRGYGGALTFGGSIEAGVNGLYFAGGGLGISTNKGSHFAVEYNAYKLLTGEDKYSFRVGYHQVLRLRKK